MKKALVNTKVTVKLRESRKAGMNGICTWKHIRYSQQRVPFRNEHGNI